MQKDQEKQEEQEPREDREPQAAQDGQEAREADGSREVPEKAQSKPSGKHRVRRIVITVLCVVLGIAVLAGAFTAFYVKTLLGRLRGPGRETVSTASVFTDRGDTLPEDLTMPVPGAADVTMPTSPAPTIPVADHVYNFLLVGQDAREGQRIQRSDTMILCTIHTSARTMTFTSLQRDMYVTIPGYGDNKLGHAFRYGAYFGDNTYTDAFALLDKTLEYNFGVQPDGNIVVELAGFKQIIDQVGGVDVEMTASEVASVNEISDGCEPLPEEDGVYHLNGQQALSFCRIRKLDGDFARNNRQRMTMNAVVEKLRSLSVLELNDLLMETLPLIWTDISDEEILSYAMELLPLLAEIQIESRQIPVDHSYSYKTVDEMSVVIVDFETNRAALAEIMAG